MGSVISPDSRTLLAENRAGDGLLFPYLDIYQSKKDGGKLKTAMAPGRCSNRNKGA